MWQLFVDTGGTFTDCVALDPSGATHTAKVLSSSALRGRISGRPAPSAVRIEAAWPSVDDLVKGFRLTPLDAPEHAREIIAYDGGSGIVELDRPLPAAVATGRCDLLCPEPAPVLAARLVTGTPAGRPLPVMDMRLGTTRGTNALLERRGAPTVLFITAGFGDLLEIGDQQRPDLFAVQIRKRRSLHAHVVEVDERLAADGSVLRPLRPEHVEHLVERGAALARAGVQSAAVALMHAYRNPEHERSLVTALRRAGFAHVCGSADLAPLIKLLPRAETAVVDAYLGPVVHGYLEEVRRHLSGGRLLVMTSAGGLQPAERYRAVDSLLSGPAGGVTGAAATGRGAGEARIIGFDMGGTSTDACRFDGEYEYRYELEVGPARLVTPALAIETVAAGGGSICSYRDERLRVGPHSAGAHPGPACYGAGGPLTVTDVNLLSGLLDPECFEIPLDRQGAETALDELITRMVADGAAPDRDELLDGFRQIANERMAAAIGRVSIARGYDPSEHALVGFGGAGGQHACAVARQLDIDRVVHPGDASLLSAVGLRGAVLERFAERQVLQPLASVSAELPAWIDELDRRAADEVAQAGVPRDDVVVRHRVAHLRLVGQETALAVPCDAADLEAEFRSRYRSVYGHVPPEKPIEVESLRVVASSPPPAAAPLPAPRPPCTPVPARRVRARFGGTWQEVPAFLRADLEPGAALHGPALVLDRRTTFVVEPGWGAVVDAAGSLVCRREAGRDVQADGADRADIVRQELFTNRFQDVVEDSGRMLQRTAISTNVKERLDFSCALLDAEGRLVVNAPHIPVHLGAMGMCVRAVLGRIDMSPGDVVMTNHPAFGGTHLPDVTVITPAFATGGRLLGYLASRAHHAEIGGIRPGSMPPSSRRLNEEGVVIAPRHLVRGGSWQREETESLFRDGPFPSRCVFDNLADLQAAVAANHRGAERLAELAARYGPDTVARYMQLIRQRATRLIRGALCRLGTRRLHAVEHLDDGAPIEVTIDVREGEARIDFAGTAPRHPGNLNATPAIVHSAIMYVLRLLIGERLPLNEGIMDVVDLRLPPGMLAPDFGDDAQAPAVAGGNVETSQRIVDTLLKAFGLCACSQGTMNNVLFGDEHFGYYETVCGGAGAGPELDGADAVHTHMTNTRLTDPEVLEHRYPVRVERFEIRRGSGGRGRHRGGDGVVRELAFLRPVALSILSQHRVTRPYGMEGGEPGRSGAQRVVRSDGTITELGPVDGCDVAGGDRLVLETPGGGGWGAPET